METNDDGELPPDPLEADIAGFTLGERLQLAGMSSGQGAARILEGLRSDLDKSPCAIRHPLPDEPLPPVRERQHRACTWWMRRPTKQTAPGSSWAAARAGCPRNPAGRRGVLGASMDEDEELVRHAGVAEIQLGQLNERDTGARAEGGKRTMRTGFDLTCLTFFASIAAVAAADLLFTPNTNAGVGVFVVVWAVSMVALTTNNIRRRHHEGDAADATPPPRLPA